MDLIDRYIFGKYGVKVTNTKDALVNTVDTDPVLLFRRNPNRISFLVINLSANTLYLWIDGQVSATRGILLDPTGGQANSWIDEDAHLTQKEWWVVGSAITTTLYAFEVEAIA